MAQVTSNPDLISTIKNVQISASNAQRAEAAAAQAQALASIGAAIAEGTAQPAGALTGLESTPTSRGAGLLQTVWNDVGTFIVTLFTILIVSGPGAVVRTLAAKLLEMPVSPEDFGAAGNGLAPSPTDDAVAFQMACLASRKVRCKRGVTYLISHLTLNDLSNFELDGNGATIVSNQTQSILGFKSVTWGLSKNIYVHDLAFYYTNNPNARTDNIFPLWFQGVNGIEVARVTVTNSWSAGIIISACSDVDIHHNNVSNTLADGITCFGCGRDVRIYNNVISNTADDAMAVTWLAGNTAAAVGEATICTKGVFIHHNHVYTTTVSARGVFIGGCVGFDIHDNKFYNVAAFSILVSNTTTVANYSTDGKIHDNLCVNSGQTASSLVGEVGGIAVYSQNLRIVVNHNELINTNNVAILVQGNCYVNSNIINGTTNTPSAQNPSLPWIGMGIVWADFTGSNTCYGTCNHNDITGTWHRPICIQAGYNTQFLEVCDNAIHDCVDPSVAGAALGFILLDTSTRNQVIAYRNRIYETRSTQTLDSAIYVAGGGLHRIDHVNIILGSSATHPTVPIANASGGTAILGWLQYTLSAGTIAANSTYSVNVTVADAHLRDYVLVSAPYQIPGLIVTAFVQSNNTVTIQVTNPTTAAITPLQGNTWTIRVRRT